MRILYPVLAIMILTLLEGCSSMTVGKSDFTCKGIDPGTCKSARAVYNKSHDKDHVTSGKEEQNNDKDKDKEQRIYGSVTSVIPDYETPIPVRTPAKVQRVWIAPYETKDGVLHIAEKSYQEIEKRRWTIGLGMTERSSERVFPLSQTQEDK